MVTAAARCGNRVFGDQPSRRQQILARLPDRRDVTSRRLRGRGGAERRPLLHQPAPLLEKIATLIRLFGLAADGVRERHFDDLSLD